MCDLATQAERQVNNGKFDEGNMNSVPPPQLIDCEQDMQKLTDNDDELEEAHSDLGNVEAPPMAPPSLDTPRREYTASVAAPAYTNSVALNAPAPNATAISTLQSQELVATIKGSQHML